MDGLVLVEAVRASGGVAVVRVYVGHVERIAKSDFRLRCAGGENPPLAPPIPKNTLLGGFLGWGGSGVRPSGFLVRNSEQKASTRRQNK